MAYLNRGLHAPCAQCRPRDILRPLTHWFPYHRGAYCAKIYPAQIHAFPPVSPCSGYSDVRRDRSAESNRNSCPVTCMQQSIGCYSGTGSSYEGLVFNCCKNARPDSREGEISSSGKISFPPKIVPEKLRLLLNRCYKKCWISNISLS